MQASPASGTTSPRGRLRARLRGLLSHRSFPVVVAILAVALGLPSLGGGWIMDDYYHRWTILRSESYRELLKSPTDIFNFFDGDPARTRKLMDLGLVPWWTLPEVKGAFWRPLTALTHVLDYRLWPRRPAMMHLHSLLWFGALAGAVALLYRRFCVGAAVAGLAALLYVIDDARAIPVGMLAGRNGMIAALFGVAAVLVHDLWRRSGWRAGGVLGPILLAAALLSAEAGIGACAYLLAYALVLDRGTWRQRWAPLVRYALVVAVWRAVHASLGYGVYAVDIYDDPMASPLRFVAMLPWRVPLYFLGQWATPPAELAYVLPSAGAWAMWAAGVALIALVCVVLWPLVRRSREARFWAVGMGLALIPACATTPMNRQLFFVGIGGMGLLGALLAGVFGGGTWRPARRAWRLAAACLGVLLIFIHLVLAPLALPVLAAYPMGPRHLMASLHVLPGMDSAIERQDLVIVNHPLPGHVAHMLGGRAVDGLPVPRRIRTLAPALSAVRVFRPDPNTLVVRPESGYLTALFDGVFRSPGHALGRGESVELAGMTVVVTDLTDDGRPAEAAFRFALPLEDPSLRWLQWADGGFRDFTPPAVGETVTLPAARLLRLR